MLSVITYVVFIKMDWTTGLDWPGHWIGLVTGLVTGLYCTVLDWSLDWIGLLD